MNRTTVRRVAVAAAGLVILLSVAVPPIPPAKARASRIHAVNNLAHPFPQRAFELTNAAILQKKQAEPEDNHRRD